MRGAGCGTQDDPAHGGDCLCKHRALRRDADPLAAIQRQSGAVAAVPIPGGELRRGGNGPAFLRSDGPARAAPPTIAGSAATAAQSNVLVTVR